MEYRSKLFVWMLTLKSLMDAPREVVIFLMISQSMFLGLFTLITMYNCTLSYESKEFHTTFHKIHKFGEFMSLYPHIRIKHNFKVFNVLITSLLLPCQHETLSQRLCCLFSFKHVEVHFLPSSQILLEFRIQH